MSAAGCSPDPQAQARQHAAHVLSRVAAVLRTGRVYRTANQVFTRQLGELLAAGKPLLDAAGELVLVALGDDLYVNGVRVPVNAAKLSVHQWVVEELRRREIAGLRMASGVEIADLEQFFALFLKADPLKGEALLNACLERRLERVLPAPYASTAGGDEGVPRGGPRADPAAAGGGSAGSSAGAARGSGGPGPGGGGDRGAGGDRGGGSGGGTGAGSGPRGTTGTGAPRGAAQRSYATALQATRLLLGPTSIQGGVEMRHVRRLVQPMVDLAAAGEPLVVGLAGLASRDDSTYAHAVNVCLTAVTMGHYLGLDRRALADLGVASLLHDVGQEAIAGEIHHELEHLDERERAALERHPAEGARLIARGTSLDLTTLRAMRVAYEHHATVPGGYPTLGEGWQPSLLSRIVAVADCYVSLCTHRGERGRGIAPYQALGMMLGPLPPKFDPALLWALVQTVGLYPAGQMVELSDGSVALSLAPNLGDLARPHVRVVVSATGEPLHGAGAIEYHPLPAQLSVRRALRGEEYPKLEEMKDAA